MTGLYSYGVSLVNLITRGSALLSSILSARQNSIVYAVSPIWDCKLATAHTSRYTEESHVRVRDIQISNLYSLKLYFRLLCYTIPFLDVELE